MSWATRNPKIIVGVILIIFAAYFGFRLTHAFFQLRSFLLGFGSGLLFGFIWSYYIARWWRKRKQRKVGPTDDEPSL